MTKVILLAAGQSRRFGPSCKLQAIFRGKPLVCHAADAIRATGFARHAIVADPAVANLLPGFEITYCTGTQSESLKAGLKQIRNGSALILLGDMPCITAEVIQNIAAAPGPALATDGSKFCPPALIPPWLFANIMEMTGDCGAGQLLRSLPGLQAVSVPQGMLRDIDLAEDLLAEC